MVHSNKRKPPGIADSLCRRYSHQERSYQSRSIRDSNGIQLLQPHACLTKSLLNHLINLLYVLPGCNLRHNPPVKLMQLNL